MTVLGIAPPAAADAPAAGAREHGSYGAILRSSAIIGAASLVNMMLAMLRAKVMATLVGPAGFGLMATFGAIADTARSVAELGINSSGVRQIAEAHGAGDAVRTARTATVLRWVAWVLGLLGALLLLLLATPISVFTFGSDDRAAAVGLLSLAVLFRLVADGQGALMQGLRRIGDLAWAGIAGTVLGTLASIALVWHYRERGIVPALVAMAAGSLAVSWWFSRRAGLPSVPMSRDAVRRETAALLRLGLAFMASGLLMSGSAYAVRIIVLRELGLDAAGLYQAAWSLGGLYVGFVLQAMGADFYPRLVAAIGERSLCNRLVNEQTRVSLLLAGPGVLATLALASWALVIFYSAQFEAAAGALRWICLGTCLRVITWPMGFVVVASGRQGLFFATELAWAVFNVACTWICVGRFGLAGVGFAFFASYLLHGALLYPIVRHLSGFRWSASNRLAAVATVGLAALVLAGFEVLPPGPALGLGLLVAGGAGLHSLRRLSSLVPPERLPAAVRWLAKRGAARP